MALAENKWRWFERHFNFDFPAEKMPDIIERLRGTSERARTLVTGSSADVLTRRDGESWSIQENIAHLFDLEPLWIGRIEDIVAGNETMREADLTNQSTSDSGYNDKTIDQVLDTVHKRRKELISLIDSLSFDQWSLSSLHPRLKTPMRVVDLCSFVADHDDYHLARCRFLLRHFN